MDVRWIANYFKSIIFLCFFWWLNNVNYHNSSTRLAYPNHFV